MKALRLRHDVAKYISRAARNLDGGVIATPLAEMLVRDLYEGPDGRPATRFAELAGELPASLRAEITSCFDELDRLEAEVRAHRPAALRRGAALALRIATTIEGATAPEPG